MKPSAPEVTYMTMTYAMSETFLAFVANAVGYFMRDG